MSIANTLNNKKEEKLYHFLEDAMASYTQNGMISRISETLQKITEDKLTQCRYITHLTNTTIQTTIRAKSIEDRIEDIAGEQWMAIGDFDKNCTYFVDMNCKCFAMSHAIHICDVKDNGDKFEIAWMKSFDRRIVDVHPSLRGRMKDVMSYDDLRHFLIVLITILKYEYFSIPKGGNNDVFLFKKIEFGPRELADDLRKLAFEYAGFVCYVCGKITKRRCLACRSVIVCSGICLRKKHHECIYD